MPDIAGSAAFAGLVLGLIESYASLFFSSSTADMVNDIPALIEYLSGFMTLQAGDVILTGTPEGVVNVNVGDEVVCEIDGIGRLLNTLVADAPVGAQA